MVAGNLSELTLQCPAISLYALHRHGSRNVGSKMIKQINYLTNALRHRFDREGYPAQLEWIKYFTHSHRDNKNLIEEGFKELIEQGRSYRSKFPHLFNDPHTQFSSSSKQRCVESALAYLYGVYGTNYRFLNNKVSKLDYEECGLHCEVFVPATYDNNQIPNKYMRQILFDPKNDYKLRYYKSCDKYVRQEETKNWKKEAEKWLTSPLFTELLDHMRESMNVPKLAPLDVITIHYACALELAIPRLVNSSQWCDLIPPEYLYTSAFYIDLLKWYRKMMPVVVESSCVLIQDALTSLKNNISANINFAHTETILPLLKYLGIVEGTMNHKTSLKRRDFWGDLTPFAGHLAFVAINCSGDIQVQALLNENPIKIPRCGTPCKLSTLLAIYAKDTCRFEEICDAKEEIVWSWIEWGIGGFIIAVILAVVCDLCSREMKRDKRRREIEYTKELKKEKEARLKKAEEDRKKKELKPCDLHDGECEHKQENKKHK